MLEFSPTAGYINCLNAFKGKSDVINTAEKLFVTVCRPGMRIPALEARLL